FYNPTYVDQLRYPMRYGQSIIVDTLSYRGLALGDTVNTVLAELNPGIEPEQYRFKLFNTRTFDENSDYKQMRKSLTCYALTDRGIPALAVEVSKQITQVGWKVHRQLEATLALLHHYGVTARVENIPDDLMETYGAGVGVRINGRPLAPGQVIDLVRGIPLTAETEADPRDSLAPTLALFASDRPGVNMLSAPRLALDTFSDLELRSDGRRVLSAKVRFHGALPGAPAGDGLSFVCWLNGQPVFVRDGQALQAVEGDQLIIEGVWGSSRPEVLNFKGYVACPTANDGQDIGWEIILDPENFIDRYRLDSPAQGTSRFQVVRETTGAAKARFFVDVVPRRVHALRLTGPHGQAIMVPWSEGGDYPLPSGDYVLADAWSNGPAGKLVPTAGGLPLAPGSTFRISADAPLEFSVRQATTFANLGTMTFRPSNMASR
ncbi:MAG: M99 family carboxypeptidase catalytic domain-containing protein, partial [Desulfovibrionaceae bacterium]